MEEKPIEIISVWHNRKNQVEKSMGSLLNQTANNFSILVVDDGSTDGTGDKLEEMVYVAKCKGIKIKLWRKENEGFTKSIKQAIELFSDKPIIALHGSGDISHPQRIERQFEFLKSNIKYVAVGCSVNILDKLNNTERIKQVEYYKERDLNSGKFPRPGSHGAAMFYRSFYLECGGYREFFKFAQDADLWLRMGNLGSIVNLEESLYTKVKTNSTISSSWLKSFEQKIYSTLAIQSEIARANNFPDPIDTIDKKKIFQYVDKVLLSKRLGNFGDLIKLIRKKKFIEAKNLAQILIRFKVLSLLYRS